jgi:hypothetical protein
MHKNCIKKVCTEFYCASNGIKIALYFFEFVKIHLMKHRLFSFLNTAVTRVFLMVKIHKIMC